MNPQDFIEGSTNEQVTIYSKSGGTKQVQKGTRVKDNGVSELQRHLNSGDWSETPYSNTSSSTPESTRNITDALNLAYSMYAFFPKEVLNEFAKAWVDSGDTNISIGATRQTNAWKKEFGFLQRKDGSLVMDELTAYSTKVSYKETLAEVGVTDFTDFEDDFNKLLVGGDTAIDGYDPVSAGEFQDRVDLVYAGVKNQIPEVEKLFRQRYGLSLDSGTIFAALVNPKVQDKVLTGDIATLQLQAQASSRGFSTTFARFEELRKLGLTSEMASGLYEQAGSTISQAASIGRELDLSTLEDYAIGDITAAKRIQRIQSELASTQGVQLGAARKDKQITGLISD